MNKVKTFLLTAALKRTVLDDISINVRASSLDHAYEIAKSFLDDYPKNTKVYGNDVPFFRVENRKSLDSELVDLDVEKDIGAA